MTTSDNSHISKRMFDSLPPSYTDVPPVTLAKKDPVPPKFEGPNKADCLLIPGDMKTEYRYCNCMSSFLANFSFYRWLDHVRQVVSMDELADSENLSWAAYHASCNQNDYSKSLGCLLPLFYEDSKSVAMLRHGMDIVKNAVDTLNPGQVPIITADQPLYTLCKQIQWTWPGLYAW